jgi:thiol-disulfide isomerase/thioredoxin
MGASSFVACVFILLLSFRNTYGSLRSEFKGVVEVDSDNIQDFFRESNGKFVLEFYAPWCGHCKRFDGAYSELAMEMREEDDWLVGRVDISANDAITGRFDVREIPTLFLKRDGNLYNYAGGTISKAAVHDWATVGFRSKQPIPWYSSPVGPIGIAKGAFTHGGVMLLKTGKQLGEYLGMSEMAGLVVLCVMAGTSILFLTLASVIVFLPTHEKYD